MEPGQSNPLPDKTKAKMIGGSIWIKVPPENANHIRLDQLKDDDGPDEVPLYWLDEDGPYGPYNSIWNPEQQNEE